jgi:decaprenylphospho-beta-D-ribofuranose 2-oxidase
VTELTGWGRYPRLHTQPISAASPAEIRRAQALHPGSIARGNGRAYGDAAIGERTTLLTGGLNRMRSFDPETGLLRIEAGALLVDVLRAFVPRGFFPPVVPGTKLVSIGGMIAADVHGKNHHRDGGFGHHVEDLTLVIPNGEAIVCSRTQNADLFAATAGGMGLTGTILEAAFRLRPIETGWMRQRTLVAADLDAALAGLRETAGATYTVAWIDCAARGTALGRSLIFAAEHATREEVEALRSGAAPFPPPNAGGLSVPFDLPAWTLNRRSVAAFNEAYFRRGAARAGDPVLVPWDPYFFPLDGVRNWNGLYGRRGFVQHQCVIPTIAARPALGAILDIVSRRANPSFLAVLKQLGEGFGDLSFPLEGYTLALDLPVSDDVFPLLDEIDRHVVAAGGRLYLAKDARQSRATFEAGYPDLARFRDIRRAVGADRHIASRLSARLGL